MSFFSVGEAAAVLGCRPKTVSDFIYYRGLAGIDLPLVGNRRMIPKEAIPQLRDAMAADGKLPAATETTKGGA